MAADNPGNVIIANDKEMTAMNIDLKLIQDDAIRKSKRIKPITQLIRIKIVYRVSRQMANPSSHPIRY